MKFQYFDNSLNDRGVFKRIILLNGIQLQIINNLIGIAPISLIKL
jgi:hypothetical protein